MSIPFGLKTVTRGLSQGSAPGYSQMASEGMPLSALPPIPKPNASEVTQGIAARTVYIAGLPVSTIPYINDATPVADASGRLIVPTSTGFIDLGQGHSLDFDTDTQRGRITPAMADKTLDSLQNLFGDAPLTYTGSDIRIMLEVADVPKVGDTKPRFAKQLLECTTMTVSIHREKAPARAAGYINPKGFARGKRTIAGTLILTQFTTEILLRFLQGVLLQADGSKDSHYSKTDQIPPFNMTILFSNEMGYASYRRLLGVELVTDGVVYSQQDMMSEQTISYMASDFTPLLPLTMSSFWNPHRDDRKRKKERTVQDVWDALKPIDDVGLRNA
jgi:hypothetical protein